jgi:ABC-2 type transport system ATP-binding protein
MFLDEPTTGLDPRARNELWGVLDHLVDEGATLLLTTQYLEEADRLADEIVVVDHGTAIARGDARSLKREVGGDQVEVVPSDPDDLARVAEILERATGAPASIDRGTRRVAAPTENGVSTVAAIAAQLEEKGIAVDDLGVRQPTLDDVFLTLTGQDAQAAEQPREPEEALR